MIHIYKWWIIKWAVILNWLKENICLLKQNGLSNTADFLRFLKINSNIIQQDQFSFLIFPFRNPKPNPNLKGGLFMLDLSVDIKTF